MMWEFIAVIALVVVLMLTPRARHGNSTAGRSIGRHLQRR